MLRTFICDSVFWKLDFVKCLDIKKRIFGIKKIQKHKFKQSYFVTLQRNLWLHYLQLYFHKDIFLSVYYYFKNACVRYLAPESLIWLQRKFNIVSVFFFCKKVDIWRAPLSLIWLLDRSSTVNVVLFFNTFMMYWVPILLISAPLRFNVISVCIHLYISLIIFVCISFLCLPHIHVAGKIKIQDKLKLSQKRQDKLKSL